MIRPTHPTLSIVRQCRLASISRSSFYHVPQGESSETLTLMAGSTVSSWRRRSMVRVR